MKKPRSDSLGQVKFAVRKVTIEAQWPRIQVKSASSSLLSLIESDSYIR